MIISLVIVGVILFIALAIVRAVKGYFMETVVPFLYSLADRLILPVTFVRRWAAKQVTTGASWAGKQVTTKLIKKPEGAKHHWRLPVMADWGGPSQLAIMAVLFLLVVAAVIHQAVCGTLVPFVQDGINALPITFAFSLVEGEEIFTAASIIEMVLFNVLALVLLRRMENVASGVVRYTYEIIFLLFSVVLVQYIPQGFYQLPEQIITAGTAAFDNVSTNDSLLSVLMGLIFLFLFAFVAYLYLTILVFALREVVANLVFALWPTAVTAIVVFAAYLAEEGAWLPYWVILLIEVVGVLLCALWFTHIRVEEEDSIERILENKLLTRYNDWNKKMAAKKDKRRYKVQLWQLRRWKHNANRYRKTGVECGPRLEVGYTPAQLAGNGLRLRECNPVCPHFKKKRFSRKGTCTQYNERCKLYQYCTHSEQPLTPPPAPRLTIEEIRYKEGLRAMKKLTKWGLAPLIFLACSALMSLILAIGSGAL